MCSAIIDEETKGISIETCEAQIPKACSIVDARGPAMATCNISSPTWDEFLGGHGLSENFCIMGPRTSYQRGNMDVRSRFNYRVRATESTLVILYGRT